jgi:hypothetical protein
MAMVVSPFHFVIDSMHRRYSGLGSPYDIDRCPYFWVPQTFRKRAHAAASETRTGARRGLDEADDVAARVGEG